MTSICWNHKWICVLLLALLSLADFTAAGGGDRIRLSDVQVITLRAGQWTAGRRSPGVPQLKCVGGSAMGQYNPQTVQCYNRGSDGNDIQWECKTDMDNDFRFGTVQVTCEGYDYPDDPYILKGSCGLEYTLELTKQGYAKKHESEAHHDYGYHGSQHHNTKHYKFSSEMGLASVIPLVIFGLIIYAIYRTCLAPRPAEDYADYGTPYPDAADGTNFRRNEGPRHRGPPAPGFRPEYGGGTSGSCSGTAGTTGTRTNYANNRRSNTGSYGWKHKKSRCPPSPPPLRRKENTNKKLDENHIRKEFVEEYSIGSKKPDVEQTEVRADGFKQSQTRSTRPSAPPEPVGGKNPDFFEETEVRGNDFKQSQTWSTRPSAPPEPAGRATFSPSGIKSSTEEPSSSDSPQNDGPGFWTGMGAGGILGYLFRGRNTGYGYGYEQPHYRTGPSSWWGPSTTTHHHHHNTGGSSWGSGGGGGSPSRSANTSTGTRTASGFGGTSRR